MKFYLRPLRSGSISFILLTQLARTFTQVPSVMPLAVLFNGKTSLFHGFHHQNITYHSHNRC